jgi:16S rRNA (adenine1518-N6/adenine1519-N6)-dimethyltransferase
MRQPFGQNFLIDKNIAAKIVSSASLTKEDTVLEIGPGKGALTELLAEAAGKVIAIEIDKNLAQNLNTRFSSVGNIAIVEKDALSLDLAIFKTPVKIVSNLPYNIAAKIMQNLLPDKNWLSAVIMVQREVAERITARARTKAYGAFSIFCQYYADAAILFGVPPSCFSPEPKVDSCVVNLINKRPEDASPSFLKLAKVSFQARRKTILNALRTNTEFSKESILAALADCAIDPMARPEELNIPQFAALDKALKTI